MSIDSNHSRREFMALLAALGAGTFAIQGAWAQQSMPLRRIPKTGETLPIIGLGSGKVVGEIPSKGAGPLEAVLRALVEHGGRVVDTRPGTPEIDSAFAGVINKPGLRDKLFLISKIYEPGQTGVQKLEQSLQSQGRKTMDLVQIASLTDLETHWKTLKDWKAAGRARYIGVTVSEYDLYEKLEQFLQRETPDIVQYNYSITERRVEEKLLPLAQDRGIGVIVNRPFMNGDYFKRLANKPLPGWATEIGIHTWADFSLKYILPHPAITSVLTETSSPVHMAENAKAALGTMPDAATRKRMAAFMDQV